MDTSPARIGYTTLHGHRSKQTMTVIVAMNLPNSPLHVVSIQLIAAIVA